jgi:hypothetical protein
LTVSAGFTLKRFDIYGFHVNTRDMSKSPVFHRRVTQSGSVRIGGNYDQYGNILPDATRKLQEEEDAKDKAYFARGGTAGAPIVPEGGWSRNTLAGMKEQQQQNAASAWNAATGRAQPTQSTPTPTPAQSTQKSRPIPASSNGIVTDTGSPSATGQAINTPLGQTTPLPNTAKSINVPGKTVVGPGGKPQQIDPSVASVRFVHDTRSAGQSDNSQQVAQVYGGAQNVPSYARANTPSAFTPPQVAAAAPAVNPTPVAATQAPVLTPAQAAPTVQPVNPGAKGSLFSPDPIGGNVTISAPKQIPFASGTPANPVGPTQFNAPDASKNLTASTPQAGIVTGGALNPAQKPTPPPTVAIGGITLGDKPKDTIPNTPDGVSVGGIVLNSPSDFTPDQVAKMDAARLAKPNVDTSTPPDPQKAALDAQIADKQQVPPSTGLPLGGSTTPQTTPAFTATLGPTPAATNTANYSSVFQPDPSKSVDAPNKNSNGGWSNFTPDATAKPEDDDEENKKATA